MKKILLILLVFISLTTVGFSIDNEFKNELTKVDIVKVSDGNYRIDLYTKNPYMGSVKAIKKGKNSYNILLPETDNSITASASNSDIKSVDIKLYPYAGQDIKNGYTKIVITTAKDINITTSVKAESGASGSDKIAKINKELEQIKKGEIKAQPSQKTVQEAQNKLKPAIKTANEKEEKIALNKISKSDVEKQAKKVKTKTADGTVAVNSNDKVKKAIDKKQETAKTAKEKETVKIAKEKETVKTAKKENAKTTKPDKPKKQAEIVEPKAPESIKAAQNDSPASVKDEGRAEQNQNNPVKPEAIDENTSNIEEINNSELNDSFDTDSIVKEPVPTPYGSGNAAKTALLSFLALIIVLVLFKFVFRRPKRERLKDILLDKEEETQDSDIPDFTAIVKEAEENAPVQDELELIEKEPAKEQVEEDADKVADEAYEVQTKEEVTEQKEQTPVTNQQEFEEIVQNKVEETKEEIKEEIKEAVAETSDAGMNEEEAQKAISATAHEFFDLSIKKLKELRELKRLEKEEKRKRREEALKEKERQEAVEAEKQRKIEEAEIIQRREQQKFAAQRQYIDIREQERNENEKARLEALRLEQEMVDRARIKREEEKRKQEALKAEQIRIEKERKEQEMIEQEKQRKQQEMIEKEKQRQKALKLEQEMMNRARMQQIQERRELSRREQTGHTPVIKPTPIKQGQPDIITNDEGIDIINLQIDEPERIDIKPEKGHDIAAYAREEIIVKSDERKETNKARQKEPVANTVKQSDDEAKILTSVKIESDRGFYLAEFMGKYSLIGFINNDIYVIHTFKDGIKDLNIKYRLVDSGMDKDFYIIRVDKMKFLIRSTKSELKLELAV